MRKAIDQDTLGALVEAQVVREVRAVRQGEAWALQARLGSVWLPVRSRREQVRIWASLTALGKFCEKTGIRVLLVEL